MEGVDDFAFCFHTFHNQLKLASHWIANVIFGQARVSVRVRLIDAEQLQCRTFDVHGRVGRFLALFAPRYRRPRVALCQTLYANRVAFSYLNYVRIGHARYGRRHFSIAQERHFFYEK